MNPKVAENLESLIAEAQKLPIEKPAEQTWNFEQAWRVFSGKMQATFGKGWRELEDNIEPLGFEGRKNRIIAYIKTIHEAYTQPI